MKKMKRTWYVVPTGINQMISEAFPNASEHRELHLGPRYKNRVLDFVYELTAQQMQALCQNCINSYTCSLREFNTLVFVKCGENQIRPATTNEWNPVFVRDKKKRERAIKRFIRKKPISRGFFPHSV